MINEYENFSNTVQSEINSDLISGQTQIYDNLSYIENSLDIFSKNNILIHSMTFLDTSTSVESLPYLFQLESISSSFENNNKNIQNIIIFDKFSNMVYTVDVLSSYKPYVEYIQMKIQNKNDLKKLNVISEFDMRFGNSLGFLSTINNDVETIGYVLLIYDVVLPPTFSSNSYLSRTIINSDGDTISKDIQSATSFFNNFSNEKKLQLQTSLNNLVDNSLIQTIHYHDSVFYLISTNYDDYYYAIEFSSPELFGSFYQTIILLIILIVFSILVAIATSLYFARILTRPIRILESQTSNITQRQFQIDISKFGNDEIGKLARSFKQMVDEIKSYTDSIKSLSERYQNLYDGMPEMLRSVGLDGKINNCNKKYCETLEYSKNEVIGAHIFDHVADHDKKKLEQIFQTWKGHGNVQGLEIDLESKSGKIVTCLISVSNLYDANNALIGSNTVLVNISELKQLQEKLKIVEKNLKTEKLLTIGELSARIAHDIKNPLTAIKNSVIVLRMKTIQEKELTKYFESVEKSIRRIDHQINDVLNFVKTSKLDYSSLELKSFLQDVLTQIMIPKHISVELPKEKLEVRADLNKLEIVFINLIHNSIHAIGDKDGSIKIFYKKTDNLIHIYFQDSGIGIPKNIVDSVFEPLTTTKQQGTGLGLTTCKNIIEQHGGSISVSLNPTTFHIVLPV
ncbi:PAS/PAC sensor signal transduction histidine kinase [Candidatus Nitrosopumilus koreensis AR1]|uniref:histidine kinase n=2 Tax=Nitrosopumilaceae TaxID=338190 RepID=K0B795_9ARCH|nr:PAS/PAC sensor signal transduction histidine kinase [Candidatus Nitrosopumilus koreensis AR1]